MRMIALALLICAPLRALACDLALVLAVDVSGSVDRREYRIQMDGLAEGLRDGIVTDALVDAQAQVTLIQWSGTSRQAQVIPWTAITTAQDVVLFADEIATVPRHWQNYATAIGEALALSAEVFRQVPDCRRKVVDVSGDGVSNEGTAPDVMRNILAAQGVTINALAIETDATDLTAYFFENVIAGEGAFVVTADGFEEYPEKIKRKLQRETQRQVSLLGR